MRNPLFEHYIITRFNLKVEGWNHSKKVLLF